MEHTIEFKIDEKKRGSFFINKDGKQIAELDFDVKDGILNAYHTGVRPEYEGQGIAAKLFDKLVAYAREHNYKIIPSCSYIAVKFRRRPDEFADIWQRMDDEPTGDACGLPGK